MAFQQPILAPSRPTVPQEGARQHLTSNVPAQQAQPAEWILFPSATPRSPSYTRTASTAYSPQTAGLSRLSEFGSLNTAARTSRDNEDEDALEDDEELDSLDEGLHAFHEHLCDQKPTQYDQNGSILPTHDGLGIFPASSFPVQEHLWQFERFNPQRRSFGHHRRRSSVQKKLDALEVDDEVQTEKEKMDRIERWRIEHSRILLNEVEKASRQNPSHQSELHKNSKFYTATEVNASSLGAKSLAPRGTQMLNSRKDAGNPDHDENVWYWIIRRLIRDLMSLNGTTLALVFGEALPEEAAQPRRGTTTTDKNLPGQSSVPQSNPKQTVSLLKSLSQELASILRRLSQSPAAVGSPVNRFDLDYAGIPLTQPYMQRAAAPSVGQSEQVEVKVQSTPTPLFNPTLNERPKSASSDFGHAALWGIEEEPAYTLDATQERDYWEQTPSIRTIFRLVHQHLTARRRPLLTSSTFGSAKASNVATTSTADSVRRAAIIRQHHPLVSRQAAKRSTTSNKLSLSHRHHGSYPNLSSPLFRRSESSCASISVRKSKRGSGSSRNYWDIKGSVGSGSMGGMGVWGEV
ncbi:MAG: hypothetical protein Q9166_002081 [cf. Caloplaca sp. 2 TL-2023]